MVGLQRKSSPDSKLNNRFLLKNQGEATSSNIESIYQNGGMTGVNAVKVERESISPTVWRKTSHPPLYFNNNETRNRNLQLQLRNRGTKDDWGASLRYDIDPMSMTKLDEVVDIDVDECSVSADLPTTTTIASSTQSSPSAIVSTSSTATTVTVPTPVISSYVFDQFMLLADDLTSLVKCIMEEAKRATFAESCSLFLIDDEKNELVAKMFDHGGRDGIVELRVPMGDGVVGRVALTRIMMNVRDAHKCPFFYASVDELTGFKTRNILCFPIIDNSGALIGVAELCNKLTETGEPCNLGFTRFDEKYAKHFSAHCANSISHSIFYKRIEEATAKCHMATEMMIQGADEEISEEEVSRLVNDPRRDWRYFHENFNDFSFTPRSIGENHFLKASMMFFEDLGFTIKYRMNKRKLATMILRVSCGYRTVPYHNWSHAFAVAHFCWLMMRTEACHQALDELERLSLLIACLCHDIDHRGTTNSFQLQSKTPLAQLYSSQGSVLERHHYAQTVSILHKTECDILEQLSTVEYRTVLSNIREIILATDIAAHLKKVSRIQEMVQVGYDPISTDHHYLLTCLIMTASDLSDQSKNFRNAKMIAENIYKEFFAQGDLENEIGVKPLEMMDRKKAFVPQVQLEFLDSIGLPVFEKLAAVIPDGKSTYEAICANRLCWQTLHEEMLNTNRNQQGLDYLKDELIERIVLEKVSKIDKRAAIIASKHFDYLRVNGLSNGVPLKDKPGPFDGYLEQYQKSEKPTVSKNGTTNNNHAHQLLHRPKKITEEGALLKSIDHDDDADCHRHRSDPTTPRRLWNRTRQFIRSMSASCSKCSPLPSRRQFSSDDSESNS